MRTQNQGKCFKIAARQVQKAHWRHAVDARPAVQGGEVDDPRARRSCSRRTRTRTATRSTPADHQAADVVDDGVHLAVVERHRGTRTSSVEQIEENLLEAKKEVKDTRQVLGNVVSLLGDQVPSVPKFDPADPKTFPSYQ